jgi:hypothetical protein
LADSQRVDFDVSRPVLVALQYCSYSPAQHFVRLTSWPHDVGQHAGKHVERVPGGSANQVGPGIAVAAEVQRIPSVDGHQIYVGPRRLAARSATLGKARPQFRSSLLPLFSRQPQRVVRRVQVRPRHRFGLVLGGCLRWTKRAVPGEVAARVGTAEPHTVVQPVVDAVEPGAAETVGTMGANDMPMWSPHDNSGQPYAPCPPMCDSESSVIYI